MAFWRNGLSNDLFETNVYKTLESDDYQQIYSK